MGRKRDHDDPLHGIEDSDHNTSHGQTSDGSLESLDGDLDGSPALLSRYGFEIRIGLGVLGILGFVFAAVVAYRMVALRDQDVSNAKSPETAQAAGAKEATAGNDSQSRAQGSETSENANSSPVFSLDFPGSGNSSSQQPTQSSVNVAGDGRYASSSGGAWAIPPDDSTGEQSPSGAGFASDEGSGFSANAPSTGSPYTPLAPASPVAGGMNGGLPGQPYAASDFQGTEPGVPSGNPFVANNAGDSNVGDFFAGAARGDAASAVPGSPREITNFGGHSAPASHAGAPSYDPGVKTEAPFPGDFFAGATAISSRGDVGNASSLSAQGIAAPGNNGPNTGYQLNPGSSPLSADTTVPLRPGSLPETTNPTPAGLSGSPTAGMTFAPSAGPYAPPLTASHSDTASNIASGGGNHVMYTVQEGETLFDIARQRLGKASRWVDIYQLNRAQLGERLENFRPGLTLRLPAESLQPAAANGGTLR